MTTNLSNYLRIVGEKVFNGTLGIIIIFFIIVFIYKMMKNNQVIIKKPNSKLLLITVPAIVYFLFVAVSSPYTEIRYIIPVCSFLFIFIEYILYKVLDMLIKNNKKTVYVCGIILIVTMLMPIITNSNVGNLYLERREIVQQVEEKYSELPTIYLFNSNQNRFLDDIYMFTKIQESYILKVENANIEEIDKILIGKDISKGIVLWVNEGFEKEEYLDMIKNTTNLKKCEHISRMNACDIYYIY